MQHLLCNCPLLKTVILDIHDPWISGSIGGPTISEIFECLSVIETFSISLELICFPGYCYSGSSKRAFNHIIHLKHLRIDGVCFISETELSVIALLVWDNSIFEMSKIKYCFIVEDYSDIMLERLNELELISFINAKNQLDFVRLILARSPVPKKVRIFPHSKIPKKEKLEIKILGDSISYPCASPKGRDEKKRFDHLKQDLMDVVFDGTFGGVGDEEVVVREGLDEEALVEFMVEWYEEDKDDDRSGEDDLIN
ncbi:hypothetical protein Tco_0994018 [Tanacetum coccineum]